MVSCLSFVSRVSVHINTDFHSWKKRVTLTKIQESQWKSLNTCPWKNNVFNENTAKLNKQWQEIIKKWEFCVWYENLAVSHFVGSWRLCSWFWRPRGFIILPDSPETQFITRVLSKLPQRVVWKHDGPTLLNLGPNIKTMKWLPQNNLLGKNIWKFCCKEQTNTRNQCHISTWSASSECIGCSGVLESNPETPSGQIVNLVYDLVWMWGTEPVIYLFKEKTSDWKYNRLYNVVQIRKEQ